MSARACQSCRFFGAHNGIEVWDDAADNGDGDFITTDHHTCARIIHGNGSSAEQSRTPREPAVVTDGSGYAARLRVLPTFGCVLHEATP